jgi:large-conductance mechanosensitive channel
MTDTIDLNLENANTSQQYSSSSSLGGSTRSRFKYRGRMMAVKAMNQLPPVSEKSVSSPNEFKPLNKNRKALYFSIIAVLAYIFIGTVTYTLWVDEWNVADSMYFSVATITTIGYGDIVPFNDGQRAFTLFYVIGGAFLVGGIFFGLLFDHIYNTFEEISKESKAGTSDYFIHRLDNGGPEGFIEEEEQSFWSELLMTFGKVVPLLVALIVPPLIMGYYEDWNVLSSFYYTVITASTVGYGDIAPKETWMRVIAVFFMPTCVFVMARSFSKLTAVYLRHKAKATEKEYFNRKLSDTDFELMDIEGEGSVGYDEFLVFMLVAMGKVSPEDIQNMEELYQRLDADNDGAIRIEDLFTMAYGDAKDDV